MRRLLILAATLAYVGAVPALAQNGYSKLNFNAAGGWGFGLAPTRDFTETGGVIVAGGGINFTPAVGASGEYQYYQLIIRDGLIPEVGSRHASGSLNSVSLNLIVRKVSTARVSAYGIGGAGWYRRNLHTAPTTLLPGTLCIPVWVWWNVKCVNGVVATAVVLDNQRVDAPGLNIGGGMTFKVGDSGLKAYAEVRYHHVLNQGASPEILPLTFGLRW